MTTGINAITHISTQSHQMSTQIKFSHLILAELASMSLASSLYAKKKKHRPACEQLVACTTSTHACKRRTCRHTNKQTHICTRMHTHTNMDTFMQACLHACNCVYHTPTHPHVHAHPHPHTHTPTPPHPPGLGRVANEKTRYRHTNASTHARTHARTHAHTNKRNNFPAGGSRH